MNVSIAPLAAHRLPRGIAATTLLFLLAGLVAATVAHSAGSRVYLAGPVDDNEHVDFLYKPKTALLDEGVRIVKLHWSSWGKTSAVGTGTAQLLTYKSGDADHEHPHVAGQFSARLTLSKPDSNGCDRPVWDTAKIRRLAGTPPWNFPTTVKLDPMCFE